MTLKKQLEEFWTEALHCQLCNLPEKQRPQIRPVGKLYNLGGVVFVQINPGYIGTTKSEICSKFKSMRNRNIALWKHEKNQYLKDAQKAFFVSPSAGTWDILCDEYFRVMREVWGWPPGKYAKTIEEHGIGLDSVSIINLAQCPVINNTYNKRLLNNCWKHRTFKLLQILQPRIIVAQGKIVFDYLEANPPPNRPKILQGVHHASRKSSEEKQRLFKKIRIRLEKT